MSTAKEKTALVPVTEKFAALSKETDLAEVLLANFGPSPQLSMFDLERIRVGAGGSLNYTIVSEEGESTETPMFDAIIAWHTGQRAWWREDLETSGGGAPPDCASMDLEHGSGNNGTGFGVHVCAACPNFSWGSARKGGKGKDCKEIKVLYVLRQGREDRIFPSVLMAPVGSLRSIASYFLSLTSRRLPYYAALHTFTLEHAKNEKGIKFSRVKIQFARALDPEELARVKAYGEEVKHAFGGLRMVNSGDVQGEGA